MGLKQIRLKSEGNKTESKGNARQVADANGHPVLRRVIARIKSGRADTSHASFSAHGSRIG